MGGSVEAVIPIDDTDEFALLIRDVCQGIRPAYVEGDRVFLTNGERMKNDGVIIKEVTEQDDPEALRKLYLAVTTTAGRNDPCPCGSGKKFKKCCLNLI
jgi:uncharacterized protein YecA (UPF0149 family)